MELMLLRHAPAEQMDGVRYPDDDERPLTSAGSKLQRQLTRVLKTMGLVPDDVLTSPRRRAWQTAAIVADGFGRTAVVAEALGHHYTPDGVVALLADYRTRGRVMLIGHEPDLGELAGLLLGPQGGPAIHFRKSGVLGMRFSGRAAFGEGTLEYFYRPEDLLARR